MTTYTTFAGVNGAGKTSLYRSVYYEENVLEKRINTDEMVERLGSWKDTNLQMATAREAVKLLRIYLSEGVSFNQETTLSGNSIMQNIAKARSNGFYIVMNYIGLNSPEIAKERVRIRVSNGGHGVTEDVIEKRYYESLNNLKECIQLCNEITIYDNSNKFEQIAYIVNGIVEWRKDSLPSWANGLFV